MPIPTFAGFGTALSGLEAMQAGIDTTSENISNANTAGYVQEKVNLTDSPSLRYANANAGISGIAIGTGVQVTSISRSDDPYVDQQYWTQNGASSYSSEVYTQLDNLQSDLDDSSTSGISYALNQFFSAISSLPSSTTASSAAQEVVNDGQTLVSAFNSLSNQLSTLQSQASTQLSSLTDSSSGEVAEYANQIAQLNQQIAGATAAGTSANSLEDERSAAIDSLSALVGVTVTQNTNGADTITIQGVTGGTGTNDSWTLVDGSSPTVDSPTTAVNLPATAAYTAATGGQVGALANLASSTGAIGTLSTDLDTAANALITNVNNAMPSSTPMFTGTSASTIALSSSATSANLLALVQTSTSVTSAGGTTSASGAALLTQVYDVQSSATNAYSTFVDQVGGAVSSADETNTTNQALLTSVSNQRSSEEGVSLDEEMTNLIAYQQGYEASAKVMNTMESVLQTLIDSVGGAGV